MVRLAILFATLLMLSGAVARAEPQSFSISSAKVEKQGQWRRDPNGQQTAEQCAQFRVTDQQALRWFRYSKEISQRKWLEELDWTQCFVSGRIVTGDKREYRWELDQSGRAQIFISPTVSIFMAGTEIPFKRNVK